jgi:hypothetical protein
MRGLVGAIIAAGAMIGLGLTNLGVGLRYAAVPWTSPPTEVKFHEIDHTFQYGIVFLGIIAVIGLGIAFVGLMFHHERRFREAQLAGGETRPVP